MRQEIIDLYDEFTHRGMDRRVFMEKLTALTGGAAAAMTTLSALAPNKAAAAIVPPGDSRVTARETSMSFAGKSMKLYRARPAGVTARKPTIVVIHENRGLNAHIEDVTRRFATEGFLAVAPDLLSPMGGTPADEDKARTMIGDLQPAEAMSLTSAVVTGMTMDSDSNGKVGIVGFCWGGGVVGRVIESNPDIKAGVVYYGRVPPLEGVSGIRAPLLLHYAGQDTATNAEVPSFEAALKQAHVTYHAFFYEGAQHAFNNDTSAARYDKAAAELAWQRTIAFFKQNLT
ncbi:carboxymethylenebutenolidase [Arboricoccus pini]|uniref:Carboxymethylenebutenolidase n=1 Tax=Arboricoccus pini TaxID=1963835 RepID=A0A212Q1B6_9PROT|nr:dienelactone hydrolase family protein [Arboricoccus pini]SNB53080.1 carboxymethylenebutenolidase [Arboricoccus pini]